MMQENIDQMKKIWRLKRFILVVGAYVGGIVFGFFSAWLSHVHATAHPHQLQASEIILHNMSVVGTMLLGVLTFGVITFGVLFINGALLGVTMSIYMAQGKLEKLLLTLAPHGILEIGAFLLAGYGCFCFVSWLWYILRTGHWNCWKQYPVLLYCGLLCTIISFGMLVIAGYIEHALFFLTV